MGSGAGTEPEERAVAQHTSLWEADERVALGASDLAPAWSERRPAGRILELDAVRGFAALTVVVGHSLTVLPSFDDPTRGARGLGLVNAFKYSPLALVLSGNEAVILFFILSGFVLTLPFIGARAPSYRAFLVKRVCRIGVPYLAAVALAIACAAILGGERLPGLSQWVNARWQGGFGVGVLIGHATLLGSFDNARYDPVLWSLVHEMRISLVFPLLVLAVALLGARRSLAAALALLVAGLALTKAGARLGHPSDYFGTLLYVVCFVAGILLARHRHEVVAWFVRLTSAARAGLLVAGVLLYTYPSWMDPAWLSQAHRHKIDDILAATLGGCVFMVWALACEPVARFLRGRVPQFLGRISYSLYLLHAVVLLALAHALHGTIPTGAIIVLMWIVTLPLAAASQRWVELPAIGLGKRLAAGIDERRRAVRAGGAPASTSSTGRSTR
jgi:peptidoglycan/LPS O-acetylase OafA/YrhL